MLERMWRIIFGRTPVTEQKYDMALEDGLDRDEKEYKAVLYVNGERMDLGLPLFSGQYNDYY